MNIVHPPYVTNQYWFDKIDPSKIHVPEWPVINTSSSSNSSSVRMFQHPCEMQASMLKGCIPLHKDQAESVQSKSRRRRIRRIYYAMIAEFDAMVGQYMATLDELGLANNTVVIVTSDHGDMQMEHGQFYKNSPYDASSTVPLIIYDPRRQRVDKSIPKIIQQPTQHIDLFPTMLELAGVCGSSSTMSDCGSLEDIPKDLDGYSLVPFLQGNIGKTRSMMPQTETTAMERNLAKEVQRKTRPSFVVSQYHGNNSPMSWYTIIQYFSCENSVSLPVVAKQSSVDGNCLYKLILWGTGQEVDDQLFDLTTDPDELTNLIHHGPKHQTIANKLRQNLFRVVNYTAVAMDVAQYNLDSFLNWKNQNAQNWTDILSGDSLRWHASWLQQGTSRSLKAFQSWLNETNKAASVRGCRKELAWPPPSVVQDF